MSDVCPTCGSDYPPLYRHGCQRKAEGTHDVWHHRHAPCDRCVPSPTLPEDVEAAFSAMADLIHELTMLAGGYEFRDAQRLSNAMQAEVDDIRTALSTAQSDALRLWEAAGRVQYMSDTHPQRQEAHAALEAIREELRPHMEAMKR